MKTIQTFHEEKTKHKPLHQSFVPGSLAIVGEHLESSCGPALYIATKEGLHGAISLREDQLINLYFDALPNQKITIDLEAEINLDTSYLERIIQATFLKLKKEDVSFKKGLDITIINHLEPLYSFNLDCGLSALIMLLAHQIDAAIPTEKIVKFADAVFTDYLQLPNRFNALTAQLYAEENTVLAIRPYEKTHKTIPYPFNEKTVMVFAPNKLHDEDLKTYQNRVQVLKKAADLYMANRPIKYLAALELDDFNRFKTQLPSDQVTRYTEHIVFETSRYKDLVEMLEDNEFMWFTEYLNESQVTLSNMFDYVPSDLAFIVESLKSAGAKAARCSNKTSFQVVVGYFDQFNQRLFDDLKDRYLRLYKKDLLIHTFEPSAGALKK